MRNKILIVFALFVSFGIVAFAQTSTTSITSTTSTSTTPTTIIKLKGLENAVVKANENSNVSCVLFAKHLKYGDGWRTGKGEAVKELQDKLKEKGYFKTDSTGYFGKMTREAVKKYQKDNNIINTGNAFNLTIGQLKKDFCKKNNNDNNDNEDNLKNNPITSECKAWFDGCNSCFRSEIGGVAGCTKMYCPENSLQKPFCREYFATTSTSTLIKDCPSEKIINLMPVVCITTPCLPIDNSYYIYKGVRKEISDFDNDFVKYHCKVPENKVH